jgi:hypothetical protein
MLDGGPVPQPNELLLPVGERRTQSVRSRRFEKQTIINNNKVGTSALSGR